MEQERSGDAPGASPSPEPAADVPSAADVHELVGPVPITCEVNAVRPCTKRSPKPADYIIVWAECNCDPCGKDLEGTTANCKWDMHSFLETIREADYLQCPECEFLFKPPRTMIKRLVMLCAEPVFGIQVGPAVLKTHPESKCAGRACVIHNPSDHKMRDFPLNWRSDTYLMERTCPHGVGHPDPDDLAYHLSNGEDWKAVHGCDGCCR
jgi:DNA-directed RNA polymerase subunit RPC12/RpoP